MSARLPGSSEPISRSRPSARAPPMVAISKTAVAGSDCGSSVATFCNLAARSISSNMFKSLLLPAGPSGPNPTDIPDIRILTTGATPLASFMLLDGQCATPTWRTLRISRSPPSTQTACAANVRPLKMPSASSARVGLILRLAMLSSFSRLVSER